MDNDYVSLIIAAGVALQLFLAIFFFLLIKKYCKRVGQEDEVMLNSDHMEMSQVNEDHEQQDISLNYNWFDAARNPIIYAWNQPPPYSPWTEHEVVNVPMCQCWILLKVNAKLLRKWIKLI